MTVISKNAGPTLAIFLISILLVYCSSGFKTELGTGLKTVYKGLGVEDSYLTMDGVKHNSNDIPLGKKVVVVLDNVTGLQMKDGRYSIAYETRVTDTAGNMVLQFSDTLVEPEVSVLRSSLTVGDPMAAGQTYEWTSKFTDLNGEGKIQAAINLDVVE